MKKINLVMLAGCFLMLTFFGANAQTSDLPSRSIESRRLEIGFSKTTNVVFPFAIISVDRGSKDVLAQKASGVENILQIKAARDSFPETNLSVVTADGKLSTFIVCYSENPEVLNINLKGSSIGSGDVFLTPENVNEEEIAIYAEEAFRSKKRVEGLKDASFGARLLVNGIYVQDEVLYFKVKIQNTSNLSYNIDQLRFFIRDQKKTKRNATQEIEIAPLYTQNETDKIGGKSQQTIVYALPKFTIPDSKYLVLQLMERNGGRHLELRLKNKRIVKATVLPTIQKISDEELLKYF